MQNLEEMLSILVCPLTKSKLIYDSKAQELISEKAGLAFPVIENIPIMLQARARKI